MARFSGSRLHDFRVSFDVEAESLEENGAVFARVDGARRRVVLEAAQDGLWLTAPGIDERTKVDDLELETGESVRIGLGVADRMVRVYVNGRRRARIAHADEENHTAAGPKVSIGARGAKVRFADIRVDADLHYGGNSEDDSSFDLLVVPLASKE